MKKHISLTLINSLFICANSVAIFRKFYDFTAYFQNQLDELKLCIQQLVLFK